MNLTITDSSALNEAIAKCLRDAGILEGKEGHILIFELQVTGAEATRLVTHHELYEVPRYPELNPSMTAIEFCEINNLSTRIKNSLWRGKLSYPMLPAVKTVRELLLLSEDKLREYRGFGDGAIQQLKEALAKYGLSLLRA